LIFFSLVFAFFLSLIRLFLCGGGDGGVGFFLSLFFSFLRVHNWTEIHVPKTRPHTIFGGKHLAAGLAHRRRPLFTNFVHFSDSFPTINLPATRPNSTRSFQNGGIRTRRILGFSTANDAIMPNNHVSIIFE